MWPFQIDRISCSPNMVQVVNLRSLGASTDPSTWCKLATCYLDTNAGIAPAFSRALFDSALAHRGQRGGNYGPVGPSSQNNYLPVARLCFQLTKKTTDLSLGHLFSDDSIDR